ncbi:MAG: phage holin, LLH family [Clostridia bacterium]|nr:phage holin, LLH family [Clostridia bacterium]
MKFDITSIIEAVIILLSATVTCFLLPLVKSRLSAEKNEKLEFWISAAVKAAEQIFKGTQKAGLQKKDFVVQFLLSKGLVFDVDEVTALIESEVFKLNKEKAA